MALLAKEWQTSAKRKFFMFLFSIQSDIYPLKR